jgi:hypothetical protein
MKDFVPHLWAVTEHRIGRPIFLVAIAGQDRYRRVDLPDGITHMSDEARVRLIRSAAKRHFHEKKGDAGPFGKIVGYIYRCTNDEGWNLTTSGELIDRNAGRVFVGQYRLTLKGKPHQDISFLFRKRRK